MMALPLNHDNFSQLLFSNFLTSMAAHDHRCRREIFAEILVTGMNFQNRAVRYAELMSMLECLESGKGFSTTEIKAEAERNLAAATQHQQKLVQTIQLMRQMRTGEDPVS
jgi:hypothetical protein